MVSPSDYNGMMNRVYKPDEIPDMWIFRGSLHSLSPIVMLSGEIESAMNNRCMFAEAQHWDQKIALPQNGIKVYQLVTTDGQWMVFEEIMRAMKYTFQSRGCICYVNTNGWLQGANVITVCYGSHCFPLLWMGLVDKSCIIYNLEQLSDTSPYNQPGYLNLMRTSNVWDYNRSNQSWLKSKGIESIYIPIGYSPAFVYKVPTVPEEQKTIDVLFFGSMNTKRQNMLAPIFSDPRIKSCIGQSMFFDQRSKIVQASKIVLNLHYYDMSRLEFSRIGPLLANGCFVITEPGCDEEDNKRFEGGVVFIKSASELYERVKYYMTHADERREIANRGRTLYQSMPMTLPV
jgi:hypothetical protein